MVAPITSELEVCQSSMRMRSQKMAITEKAFWYEGIKEGYSKVIKLLKENSKCSLDGGHDKNGYCFCEAILLNQK